MHCFWNTEFRKVHFHKAKKRCCDYFWSDLDYLIVEIHFARQFQTEFSSGLSVVQTPCKPGAAKQVPHPRGAADLMLPELRDQKLYKVQNATANTNTMEYFCLVVCVFFDFF